MAENPYQSPGTETAGLNPASETAANRIAIIQSIPFRTYILLSGGIGFAGGLLVGVSAFLVSVFSPDPFAFNLPNEMGGQKVEGIWAGLCMVIISPCYFGFLLSVFAIPGIVPFRLIWKLLARFNLKVTSK